MFRKWFVRSAACIAVAPAFVFLPEAASPGPDRSPSAIVAIQPSSAQEYVTQIYDRLRQKGELSHPCLPWVVQVKHVRGDKLQFVKFMHRDPAGKGYDYIGWLGEVVLRADDAGGNILVHARVGSVLDSESGHGCFVERFFEMDLPERWPGSPSDTWSSFAAARRSLTREQKQYMDDELLDFPPYKKLQQVFGRECDELLKKHIIDLPSQGIIMALDDQEYGADSVKLKGCTTVQFDEKNPKQSTVRRYAARVLTIGQFSQLNAAASADSLHVCK